MSERPGARFVDGLILVLLCCGGCVRTQANPTCTCDGQPTDLTTPGDGPSDARLVDRTTTDLTTDQTADLPPDLTAKNHYLKFDDPGERVRLDPLMGMDSDFTVSLRIRLASIPASYSDFLIYFNYDPVSETLSGWEIGLMDSGKMRWFVVNHDKDPFPDRCEKNSSQTLPVGTWHRVTFVFDYLSSTTAQLRLFVNGQLWIDQSSPGTSCQATMAPGPFEPGAFVLGGMDQVKLDADDLWVFDRVLTDGEIAALDSSQIPAGLVLRWDMNEGAGDTLHDTSGNNRNGMIDNPDWRMH